MAEKHTPPPPTPGAPVNRVAVDAFKHAEKSLARGDYDYGLRLLRDCCQLDPLNLRYRQALRAAESKRAGANSPASPLVFFTTAVPRLKLRIARWRRDYLRVLDFAERILSRNPRDVSVHLALVEAFVNLDAPLHAVWALEEAHRQAPRNLKILRTLAQHYEGTARFKPAIAVWETIRKLAPSDTEAGEKIKGLSAKILIAKMESSKVDTAEAQALGTQETAAAAPEPAEGAAPARPQPAPISAAAARLEQETAKLQARLTANPTNPHPYLDLAACYRRADQLDRARDVLEQGLGPTGDDFNLLMELADLAIERLRRELAQVSRQLAEGTADAELTAKRDRLLEEINTRELEWYRQKLARNPADKGCALELGVRLYRAHQYKDAIPHLQAARTGPAQRVRALLHIGYAFKELGNWDLARRALEDGLRELPREEVTLRREFLFELARGAADHGDLTAAVERGNELAFLDFNYRDIGHLLEEWRGSPQKA
ncbi:MAG: hypothetical protein IT429_01755 [Gemmataceae bacterium]|nr:hypothetical protein [Gemmataceae bacterium]